jgi:hypothetical protein
MRVQAYMALVHLRKYACCNVRVCTMHARVHTLVCASICVCVTSMCVLAHGNIDAVQVPLPVVLLLS